VGSKAHHPGKARLLLINRQLRIIPEKPTSPAVFALINVVRLTLFCGGVYVSNAPRASSQNLFNGKKYAKSSLRKEKNMFSTKDVIRINSMRYVVLPLEGEINKNNRGQNK